MQPLLLRAGVARLWDEPGKEGQRPGRVQSRASRHPLRIHIPDAPRPAAPPLPSTFRSTFAGPLTLALTPALPMRTVRPEGAGEPQGLHSVYSHFIRGGCLFFMTSVRCCTRCCTRCCLPTSAASLAAGLSSLGRACNVTPWPNNAHAAHAALAGRAERSGGRQSQVEEAELAGRPDPTSRRRGQPEKLQHRVAGSLQTGCSVCECRGVGCNTVPPRRGAIDLAVPLALLFRNPRPAGWLRPGPPPQYNK